MWTEAVLPVTVRIGGPEFGIDCVNLIDAEFSDD
jgi:hypothetical protein